MPYPIPSPSFKTENSFSRSKRGRISRLFRAFYLARIRERPKCRFSSFFSQRRNEPRLRLPSILPSTQLPLGTMIAPRDRNGNEKRTLDTFTMTESKTHGGTALCQLRSAHHHFLSRRDSVSRKFHENIFDIGYRSSSSHRRK